MWSIPCVCLSVVSVCRRFRCCSVGLLWEKKSSLSKIKTMPRTGYNYYLLGVVYRRSWQSGEPTQIVIYRFRASCEPYYGGRYIIVHLSPKISGGGGSPLNEELPKIFVLTIISFWNSPMHGIFCIIVYIASTFFYQSRLFWEE